MLHKNNKNKSDQIQMISVEQLVPKDHLLRKIDKYIDFDFIYDLVEDKYSLDNGRPSIDPVVLMKLVFIQYLFNINSMRKTIREVEVNVGYRRFLGLDFYDKIPHFSTFGKNYQRRFKDTNIFNDIFENILNQAFQYGFVDTKIQFVDSTHVKAHANRHKNQKVKIKQKTKNYQKKLEKEINEDRENHGKNDINFPDNKEEFKEETKSTTDPESGLFHKGDHKEVFAYSIQTSCDKNGWILGYKAYPGNLHDSNTFETFFKEILEKYEAEKIVMDAGYKTPRIAKELIDKSIMPVFPYTRPKGVSKLENPFYPREYRYDEMNDCYICPENKIILYSTTNKDGYRIYQSKKSLCENCPSLKRCTNSKKHQKVITRHIWQSYLDYCEWYRLTKEGKEEYKLRKETIERQFGSAKEYHSFRYTNMIGKAKMDIKAALTFACLNMKKLAILLDKILGRCRHTPPFYNKILVRA